MTETSLYDEQELLRRVARGDEDAFRRLYYQFQPFLATHIFRITDSRELTEEIIQDVFLKIWQTRENLYEIRSFKAYLLVISKNHALNAIKKIAREFDLLLKYTLENKPAESEDYKSAYYSLLDEAIDNLSTRQKEVYLLSRHERLTYQQIAEKRGIGKESVKTHIELAIKNISEYVKKRLSVAALFILFLQ